MLKQTRQAAILLLLFTFLFGLIYPLISTLVIQKFFPEKAQGSLIIEDKKIIGSKLIGQNFSEAKYFWGRLSATSPNPYNAGTSSGSNLSVNNPALILAVEKRIDDLKKFDPENNLPIPVDLVTASASGLDPEISIAAANYQLKRVAKFSGIDINKVTELVTKHTSTRQFRIFGEARVNVLTLNLEIKKLHDQQTKSR